jgi:hypothetical protein
MSTPVLLDDHFQEQPALAMDLTTQPQMGPKAVVPTTPHVKATQALDADPVPPTPSKPKTKETEFALNDETADFTVICEGERFAVHKSVLESTSPYFARMFRFNGSVRIVLSTHM